MKRSAAVAFWGADESGRAFDAEEGELVLEVVGHVLRSVVVANREAGGDLAGKAVEVAA